MQTVPSLYKSYHVSCVLHTFCDIDQSTPGSSFSRKKLAFRHQKKKASVLYQNNIFIDFCQFLLRNIKYKFVLPKKLFALLSQCFHLSNDMCFPLQNDMFSVILQVLLSKCYRSVTIELLSSILSFNDWESIVWR